MSQLRFNAMFITQRSSLLRTLQRMVHDPSAAEDLLQETYLRVNRALGDRTVEHLEPFVFQTARNLALDYLRSRRLHELTIVEDAPLTLIQSVAAPQSALDDAAHTWQLLDRLHASLASLTPRQQRTFTLSRIQGCSYLEIAGQLKVSPSTVQKDLKLIMAICVEVAQRMDDSC